MGAIRIESEVISIKHRLSNSNAADSESRWPLTVQGTKFTSFPSTTITRRGALPANHFLAMSLASASNSKVALARQQIALQVFHIGIVPFEN
jgi:hypothetical protein